MHQRNSCKKINNTGDSRGHRVILTTNQPFLHRTKKKEKPKEMERVFKIIFCAFVYFYIFLLINLL